MEAHAYCRYLGKAGLYCTVLYCILLSNSSDRNSMHGMATHFTLSDVRRASALLRTVGRRYDEIRGKCHAHAFEAGGPSVGLNATLPYLN